MRNTLQVLLNGLLFGGAAALGIGIGAWYIARTTPQPASEPASAVAADAVPARSDLESSSAPVPVAEVPALQPVPHPYIDPALRPASGIDPRPALARALLGDDDDETPSVVAYYENTDESDPKKRWQPLDDVQCDGPTIRIALVFTDDISEGEAITEWVVKHTAHGGFAIGTQVDANGGHKLETRDVKVTKLDINEESKKCVTATLVAAGTYEISFRANGDSHPARFVIRPKTDDPPRITAVQLDEAVPYFVEARSVGASPFTAVLPLNDSLKLEVEKTTANRRYSIRQRTAGSKTLGTALGSSEAATGEVLVFTRDGLAPLDAEYVVVDEWTRKVSRPFHLRVRDPRGLPIRPTITHTRNGVYAEPTALDENVDIYLSYLALLGTDPPANAKPTFPVFVADSSFKLGGQPVSGALVYAGDANAEVMVSDPDWSAVLTLPRRYEEGTTGHIRALADATNGFAYSGDPVAFTVTRAAGALAIAPKFDSLRRTNNGEVAPINGIHPLNEHEAVIVVGAPDLANPQEAVADTQLVALVAGTTTVLGSANASTNQVPVEGLADGENEIELVYVKGSRIGKRSERVRILIRKGGFVVTSVVPPDFGTAPGRKQLRITFDSEHPLPSDVVTGNSLTDTNNVILRSSGGTGRFDLATTGTATIKSAEYDGFTNSIVLKFDSVEADVYRLEIRNLVDIFGNELEGEEGKPGTAYLRVLKAPETKVAPGEGSDPGKTFVEYPEYTRPREVGNGFNPSDRVETRVVRLYYYRNAPRVAQIINREVRSYNAQGADAAQLLADKASGELETLTAERRQQERQSERAAQALRRAEQDFEQDQRALQTIQQRRAFVIARNATLRAQAESEGATEELVERNEAEITRNEGLLEQLREQQTTAQSNVNDSIAVVETARTEAFSQQDSTERLQAEEDILTANVFRLEVAAATADPDTYAAGKPKSDDPVRQVSVSVIGEGVLQLRGPIKGLNVVRTMINQIDAPVGQVRVAIHTVQVNGEREKRMERVVDRIERYIDHSRFLTMQSALMLRKAVQIVASRKAEQFGPGGGDQATRDERYLYAFYGRDFIDELHAMDSEFLRTGNKVLSLHSMDTTSLSSALFTMALAKNSTRQEILAEFQQMLQCELPRAEMDFFDQSSSVSSPKKMPLLGTNARFRSLHGFFDAQIGGDDTMTPLQREFVRLAQIFKARLVTERELRLRVMERGLIEDRLGDYLKELQAAKDKEQEANKALLSERSLVTQKRIDVLKAVPLGLKRIDALEKWLYVTATAKQVGQIKHAAGQVTRILEGTRFDPEFRELANLRDRVAILQVRGTPGIQAQTELRNDYGPIRNALKSKRDDLETRGRRLYDVLTAAEFDPDALYDAWDEYYMLATQVVTPAELAKAENAVGELLVAGFRTRLALANAKDSRRPLDHKKLLDMLIDQMEDKYIDLVEGTRAHTANVDNYVKRIATALEDDFNTQFYDPAFRCVREASTYYDVTLGQVETTSVLANNRAFAKVDPQATFEFDLPKRDIMITEAMQSAKAAIDTYGALTTDPTFLSLSKLYSGQPTATLAAGRGGNFAPIRTVLPGLPSEVDERLLQQPGPGAADFQTPFDGLVPDPSIYKFETGTGFEIRPVIQPDGQAVVFHLNYMYTTNVREPVRADEKHLGRVKRHYVDTDVQLGNYELRKVSRYRVALKASRTSRGVPLLEDAPGIGALFRPRPSDESALQQNLILSHAVIYPTLYDLMGLRWAPAVADLDPLRLSNTEFVTNGRETDIRQRVHDYTGSQVDTFMRIPEGERRGDLYRSQETIPGIHPNGYHGPGLNLRGSRLREGVNGERAYDFPEYVPDADPKGAYFRDGETGYGPSMEPVTPPSGAGEPLRPDVDSDIPPEPEFPPAPPLNSSGMHSTSRPGPRYARLSYPDPGDLHLGAAPRTPRRSQPVGRSPTHGRVMLPSSHAKPAAPRSPPGSQLIEDRSALTAVR